MEIALAGTSEPELQQYSALFSSCFPRATHLREPYLRWLYRDNPAGAMVGFNAWDGDRLAAHYACVPAHTRVLGAQRRALLSLNTATHPEYQGRGLFVQLAERTYAAAAASDFELVYGAANASSTPGFIRKLGFQLVAPLDSRIGVGRLGRIDWGQAQANAAFARSWSEAELSWRMANPSNPVRRLDLGDGSSGFCADAHRFGFRAWAELPIAPGPGMPAARGLARPRVFLGAFPAGSCRFNYAELPSRLRPSPLNFILRGLKAPISVGSSELLVGFLDFDAF